MMTYSLDEAAKILQVSPRSLADKRYRFRLGLAARKVGRRVIFLEADLKRFLDAGRESLPGERRGERGTEEMVKV